MVTWRKWVVLHASPAIHGNRHPHRITSPHSLSWPTYITTQANSVKSARSVAGSSHGARAAAAAAAVVVVVMVVVRRLSLLMAAVAAESFSSASIDSTES